MAFRGTEIKPLQKMVVVQVVAKRSRYDWLFGGGGEEGGGGGVSYLSLSSTPPSGNGPRWREAGAEEGRELSFSFPSPGEEAKRR